MGELGNKRVSTKPLDFVVEKKSCSCFYIVLRGLEQSEMLYISHSVIIMFRSSPFMGIVYPYVYDDAIR